MGLCGPLTFTGDLVAQSRSPLCCAARGGLKAGLVGERVAEAEARGEARHRGPRSARGGAASPGPLFPAGTGTSAPSRPRGPLSSPAWQWTRVGRSLLPGPRTPSRSSSGPCRRAGCWRSAARPGQRALGGRVGAGPHAPCCEGTSQWPEGAGGAEVFWPGPPAPTPRLWLRRGAVSPWPRSARLVQCGPPAEALTSYPFL